VSINRIDLPPTAPTTRREFLSGSSALLAGTAIAGLVSQSACSNDSTAQPAASAETPSAANGTQDSVAQPTTTNYEPRCWLVASDLATAGLTNGAQVTQWADRTDSAYDVQFQASVPDINGVWPHTPPTLVLNAVNDLPAVSFAASQSQSMIWAPGGSLDQGLTGFSAVFVIRPDTSVIYDASYLFITHTAEQATRLGIVFNPTQGGVRAIINTAGIEYNLPTGAATSGGVPFGALHAPVWGVLSLRVWYGLNPNATLQVNGVSSSISFPSATTPNTPSYIVVLASTSEINHLTCQIAEMSFYPGYLSDAQLASIESGLQTKYAIPA
jgi:hypothetical protein